MVTEILDTTPPGMAELLDGLAQGLLEGDREAASILLAAREGLRNLGNNRWTARINWQSEPCAVRSSAATRGHRAVRHA